MNCDSWQEDDGGDGGGVKGERAAKPATAVWHSISKFVSVKPLDIFNETLWEFSAVLGIL